MAKVKDFWATLSSRKRLWSIYMELGYIPWRKPRNKKKRQRDGVYIGTREAIPFMNEDAKRTFSHLLLRPGYMMRDYILRGQHERYLAPFTALLVFYSVFTLIVAVVQPTTSQNRLSKIDSAIETVSESEDSLFTGNESTVQRLAVSIVNTVRSGYILTRLDLHPELADTPWKASLAAVESDLRSKGIPLFLGNFLMLWMAMAFLLRKRGVSVSGAAAASAYVLCQYCIFMFLALLLSLGRNKELGVLLMGLLLFIDYRQFLNLELKPALKLTIRTGLFYLLVMTLFYLLLAIGIVLFAVSRV